MYVIPLHEAIAGWLRRSDGMRLGMPLYVMMTNGTLKL
jgi:hypothetical protein